MHSLLRDTYSPMTRDQEKFEKETREIEKRKGLEKNERGKKQIEKFNRRYGL